MSRFVLAVVALIGGGVFLWSSDRAERQTRTRALTAVELISFAVAVGGLIAMGWVS